MKIECDCGFKVMAADAETAESTLNWHMREEHPEEVTQKTEDDT